jgi:hypothetical protein
MTTKAHGWELTALGAWIAASIINSTSSRLIGLSLYARMARRS